MNHCKGAGDYECVLETEGSYVSCEPSDYKNCAKPFILDDNLNYDTAANLKSIKRRVARARN